MSVATSTVGREFKESATAEDFSSQMETGFETHAADAGESGMLTDSEKAQIMESLARLRIPDLKVLLRDRGLPTVVQNQYGSLA